MGKASRKKRSSLVRAGDDQRRATQAIALLNELADRWIVRKDGQLVGVPTGSIGVAVLLFHSEEEARQATGSSGEPEVIEDTRRLMSDMAESGIPSLVEAATKIELQAACRLDEVARPTPTYLAFGEARHAKAAMTRTGRVLEGLTDLYLVPWRRFDLIDQAIARSIGSETQNPFPGIDEPLPIWALDSPDAWPLFSEFPVVQPWPVLFGCFAFFTSESAAIEFVEGDLGGARAFVHPRTTSTFQKPRPRPVDCLIEHLRELLPASGPTRFVINPFGARSMSAIGSVDSPYIRTVAGVWELQEHNQVRFLRPWSTWTALDTFHWDGTGGVRLKVTDRSVVADPDIDVDNLTADERRHLVDLALSRESATPPDLLEGFLLVVQHTIDSSRWTWHMFPDFAACLGWMLRFDEQVDLPIRISGIDPSLELGIPPGQAKAQRDISAALATAAERLASRGVIERYAPQTARDLTAMCNAVLRTRRVHVAGYVKDLAIQANEDEWLSDLVSALGPDGYPLVQWLDDNNEFAVDPQAESLIQDCIGKEAWRALDPRSRHFLGSAVALLEQHRGRDDLDHSPVIVEACKAIEVELAALAASFRSHPEVDADHDPNDRNDLSLRSFLDGTQKLTLGNFGRLLRPGADASPIRAAFGAYVAGLPGGDYLTHRDFASSFLTKISQRRNPASHDSPADWSEAEALVATVIGEDKKHRSTLRELVRWKTGSETLAPPPMRQRFEPCDGHLVMEQIRFDFLDPISSITDEDDYELLPFLEESGLTDTILGFLSGSARPFAEEGFAKYRQRHQRPAAAGLTKLAPLQRAVAELHANPFWDQHEPAGMIDSDGAEVVWRVAPGHLIGRSPEGTVVHFSVHHSGREGDAVDTMLNTYDESTISSLATFFASADSFWIAQRGGIAIERTGSDSSPRLSMFLRRTRPPGGWIPVHFGVEAGTRFTEIVDELARGKWGELAAPQGHR